MSEGLIVKALSGFYYVSDSENTCGDTCGGTVECRARGSFRKNDNSPLVGDRVIYNATDNGSGIIEKILPRKNQLVRPAVANIDKLFVVVSVADPKPNTLVIDKVIMNAENNSIEPVIIINKCDLSNEYQSIADTYVTAGFTVLIVSAKSGLNTADILPLINGCTCAFTGNSGVGKSSIINAIDENVSINTAEISQKLGRGRHTTRHIELYSFGGGYIVDTPGFSSFDMDKCGFIRKENIQFCFRDFLPYKDNCKFTGCSHTKEKGCAVISAVNEGKIPKSRFDSYCRFYEESAAIPDWQIDKNGG